MKKSRLDDYELFYMEIPQADYLNDIDLADEENEAPTFNNAPTMSDEQVSALALDQLGATNAAKPDARSAEDTLFSRQATE